MKSLIAPLRELDRKSWIILFGGTVAMTVYIYKGHHNFFAAHASAALRADPLFSGYRQLYQFAAIQLLLLWAPLFTVLFVFREKLRDYGLQLGDWRYGLKTFALAAVIVLPFLWMNSFDAEMRAEYPLTKLAGYSPRAWLLWSLIYLTYYIPWEFFFRGFMIFGLAARFGVAGAILFETIPSTLLHIGKPFGETFGAIFAGVVFGAIAWRTRSILYVLLLHWYLGAVNDLFCVINGGGFKNLPLP